MNRKNQERKEGKPEKHENTRQQKSLNMILVSAKRVKLIDLTEQKRRSYKNGENQTNHRTILLIKLTYSGTYPKDKHLSKRDTSDQRL